MSSRFSATARHYRYLLLNHPVRPALLAGRVGWIHQRLDLATMQQAASLLLGEATFRVSVQPNKAQTPVKLMKRIDVHVEGNMVICDFSAAFSAPVVRNIMGALLHIGQGISLRSG